MAEKWTPGPWCYENIGEKENLYAVGVAWRLDDESFTQLSGHVSSYDEDGNEVLHRDAVCFLEEHATDGSIHADARLIAAAPELYAALADLVYAIACNELMPESVSYLREARAALAKARGE